MAYLEVVTSIVLAWLLLGEALSVAQLVGAAAVVTGAFLAQTAVPDTSAAQGPETLPTAQDPAPQTGSAR